MRLLHLFLDETAAALCSAPSEVAILPITAVAGRPQRPGSRGHRASSFRRRNRRIGLSISCSKTYVESSSEIGAGSAIHRGPLEIAPEAEVMDTVCASAGASEAIAAITSSSGADGFSEGTSAACTSLPNRLRCPPLACPRLRSHLRRRHAAAVVSVEGPTASTAVCGAEAKLADVASAAFSSVGSTMPASGFAAELSSAAWATVAAAA